MSSEKYIPCFLSIIKNYLNYVNIQFIYMFTCPYDKVNNALNDIESYITYDRKNITS